jgi:hypothetical protein
MGVRKSEKSSDDEKEGEKASDPASNEVASADDPTPETPKPKLFRILNTGAQTLYLTLPGRTLVLEAGASRDVPETDIVGNPHIKVMVRRGHIALFEH